MTQLAGNIPFKISTSDPIAAIDACDEIVIGQIGQTLDGYIATPTGNSKYINGESGLAHLHQVRNAVDAVIVGVGSVIADNPKLTVRLCEGHHPARVVIDPQGRINMNACMFNDNQAPVIIITAHGIEHPAADVARILHLPCDQDGIAPAAITAILREEGYRKTLVEGGSKTLSGFMNAGIVDRLHMIVAPMIMGSGKPGMQLSPIDMLSEAMRPEITLHPLGGDILFDCNLKKQTAS